MDKVDCLNIYFYCNPETLVGKITSEPITHVCFEARGAVYNISQNHTAGWYLLETFPEPDIILHIPVIPFDVERLEELPVGRRYPKWTTALWWFLLRLPPEPYTCVRATREALGMGGIQVRERTPYGLYEELQRL
jgi:hypothetical protein